jgi:uncharacterized protein involved in exopolysaccharide biosynthesis
MSQQISTNKSYEPAFEIHLADILTFFSKYILLLVITGFCAGALGILGSFFFTKKYTATTILLPEYSSGKSSFFSLAMGGNSSEGIGNLTPDLYPNVLESTSFGEFLLKEPIVTQSGQRYSSLREYMKRDTSVSILMRIKSLFSFKKKGKPGPRVEFKNSNILNYSSEEQGLISGAKSLVKASLEQKNGLVSIESELPDPIVAAMLVEASRSYLVNYVEEFRTAKLTQQLEFLSSRVRESRRRLKSAEYALQSYRDRNRNAFLNVARIEEQRLQSDYTLAQSIYSDLVIKEEQIKIKVKEERPVFKVLEPIKVPLNTSSPNRTLFGIAAGLFGAFVVLAYLILFREGLYRKLIKKNS